MNTALIREYYSKLLAKYSLAPTVILILLLSITSVTYDRYVAKQNLNSTLSRNALLADQIINSFTHSTSIIAKSSFSSIALKFGDFTGYRSVVVPWISDDKTIQGIIMFDQEHKPVLTWPSNIANLINPQWVKQQSGIQAIGERLIVSHDIFENTEKLGSLAFITDTSALGLEHLNIDTILGKDCGPISTSKSLFVCAGHIGDQKLLFTIITILISVLGLLTVFFFSISRLSNFLSHPVNALQEGLLEMKKGKSVDWNSKFDSESDLIFRPIGERFSETVKELNKLNSNLTYKTKISDMAKKLAHDIRSPLSALNIIAKSADPGSESAKQLMESSIKRINDISLELLKTAKLGFHGEQKCELTRIDKAIEEIFIEKKIQHESQVSLSFNNILGECSVFIDESDFKCAISNLLNNSIEAVAENGKVELCLKSSGASRCLIEITDNGTGIPPQVLENLGKAPVSLGKEDSASGSGIGVYNASKLFQNAQGNLSFQSVLSQGTKVVISLPFPENQEFQTI